MKKSFLEYFDFILIFSVLILVGMGVAFIYSSGINSSGVLVTNEYIKQIIWACIGLFFMIFFCLYDYRKFSRYAMYFYFAFLAVLIYTRIFGRYVNGARSWIGIGEFGVQPSEFGKVFYTIMLAKYLDSSINENQLKRIITALVIFMGPTGLILIQPDLGTATVYIPIFFIMCYIAGIPVRYLLFLLGSGTAMIVFTILPVWNEYIAHNSVAAIAVFTNFKLKLLLIVTTSLICILCIVFRRYFHFAHYYYWIAFVFAIIALGLIASSGAAKVLKDYQIKRLIVFMDPNVDRLGAGWNIIQSKIAIGAGGLFGRSFLHGTQSHYRFLPQQSTDFIFSILSEELGFLGGIIVFTLYMVIMIRTLIVIKNSSNRFGSYIASGFLGMYMIHFFINVGMVMGIMPITGIPLLFLSYGGSSLLTAMTSIGIIMSINNRKYDFA